MTTKTPTLHSVQAHIKRAAKAQGLGVKATRTCGTVLVESLYHNDAERLGLTRYEGQVSSWLRSVLSEEELLQVEVCIVVNNSDPMTDYFHYPSRRVNANWAHLVAVHDVSNAWANNFIYGEGSYELERYAHGDLAYTVHEVEELAPSAHAARALAVAHLSYLHQSSLCLSGPARPGNWAELIVDRDATRGRIMALDSVALELLLGMLSEWTLSAADLVDAVEVLVPQEAPAPAPVELAPVLVEPAQVEPVRVEPAALVEYLGRLLHAPKKEYAVTVWAAVRDGAAVPEHSADWAADVVRKVRRYATA